MAVTSSIRRVRRLEAADPETTEQQSVASPTSRSADGRTLVILAAMYALLIGNFCLYWSHPGPVLLHILLSTVAIHLAFTVWHETVHRNVSHRAWINNAVGMAGILPYMFPYFMQRWIHLQHHAKLNQEEDPNHLYIDGPFWQIPLRYLHAIPFLRKLRDADPRTPAEKVADVLLPCSVLSLYAIGWYVGVLIDLLLLWFLPVLLAKIIMDWYINYLPHVGLPAHRFRGTRIIDVPWFTPLVLGHNYHAIHHLWPGIPWHRYKSIYTERRSYLKQHGVPIEHRVIGGRTYPGNLVQQDPVAD